MTRLEGYHATHKATPLGRGDAAHHRVRRDKVDKRGRASLCCADRFHHLAIGGRRAGKHALILGDDHQATAMEEESGDILRQHLIGPTRTIGATTTEAPTAGWNPCTSWRDSEFVMSRSLEGIVPDERFEPPVAA